MRGPATHRYPAYGKENPTKPTPKSDVLGKIQAHNGNPLYLRFGERKEEEGEEEDIIVCLHACRYKVEVNRVSAGNWILMEGIDQPVVKTSTILDMTPHDEVGLKS